MTPSPSALMGLLPLLLATALQAEDGSTALLARLAAANRSITTITGQFTQKTTHGDDAGAEPNILKAVFAVQFPDQYDLVFTRPDDAEWRQRLCCDGERRWTVEQAFANLPPDRTVTRVGDQDGDFKRLFACLRLDLPLLEKDYDLNADQDGGLRVTMTPKAGGKGAHSDQLVAHFDASNHLQHLVLTDGSRNRHEITVERAEYGLPLPRERFKGPDDH